MCGNRSEWMTCDCCGGHLPPQEIWDANRNHAGDCDGSVHPATDRCRAFADDDLWEMEEEESEL